MSLLGVRLIPDPTLVETKCLLRERKWARRVRFERWRRFDVIVRTVPSQHGYRCGDAVICHPDVIERVRKL